MTRNKLYLFLSAACIAGLAWIIVTYNQNASTEDNLGLCLFKRLTTIPCPSCGSTRSVLSILKGDFSDALMWNPLGFLLIFFLLVTPFWILMDVIRNKSTLLNFYRETEHFLQHKWVAISAILIVMLNWIWNIYKGI